MRVDGTVRRERVITFLLDNVAGVSAADAEATLDRVATGRSLVELDRHFHDHPDALTAASARVPLALVRLAHVLHDAGHTTVSVPVCAACGHARRPLHRCCECGRDRPAQALWPIGAVCTGCYTRIRSNPHRCPGCATTQPLIATDQAGRGICGPCAGVEVDFACAQCGCAGNLYQRGRCAACVLANRLAALLADDTGTIPDHLGELHRALTNSPSGPTLTWLTRGRHAGHLAALARATSSEITHHDLDALPHSRSVDSLRALLVHTGVLPDRAEHLDRIEPWVRRLVAEQPARVQHPVLSYTRWAVVARKRAAHATKPVTAGAGEHAREKIRAALYLLTWLETQNLQFDRLAQPDFDRYLATVPARRYSLLRPFISWAGQHGFAPRLDVPVSPKHDPHLFLDDTSRTALLRRCLTDGQLPLWVRVAGALVLLFGLTSTRVATLTDQDIQREGDSTFLQLADKPISVPPKLAVLLCRLVDQRRAEAHLRGDDPAAKAVLLFPGRPASRALHPAVLRRRLREHGIPVQASQNTARAALAEDLPAPILAELTGLSVTAATAWAKHVNRNWTHYLASRRVGRRVGTG